MTVISIPCNPGNNQAEWRTALVTRGLERYKADIAALNVTRFSEQDQLEEVGAGCTFFWSGRPRAERRDAGVTFAVLNDIVRRLPPLSQDIKDRLMSLRLPLWGGKFATIVSVYASPMTRADAVKNKSYKNLQDLMAFVLKAEKLASSLPAPGQNALHEPAQSTASSLLTPASVFRRESRPLGCIPSRDTGTCWTMASYEGVPSGTCW
nr:unnamed protein product [Spirometra erinaceieuropaei]